MSHEEAKNHLMNTFTKKDGEMAVKGLLEPSRPVQGIDQAIESENYSLGTIFGSPYKAPMSTLWVADFLGAAFLTGASWPAVFSISSSKLLEAFLPATIFTKKLDG